MGRQLFSDKELQQIRDAVKQAELNTSGEIRVHIEKHCREDVLDRASGVFDLLGMQKTVKRNGVLFYLATEDHKFAILGDAGINALVPSNFWDAIKDEMAGHFKNARFTEGLENGIRAAGRELKAHFPYEKGDVNELSNDISFGK